MLFGGYLTNYHFNFGKLYIIAKNIMVGTGVPVSNEETVNTPYSRLSDEPSHIAVNA